MKRFMRDSLMKFSGAITLIVYLLAIVGLGRVIDACKEDDEKTE